MPKRTLNDRILRFLKPAPAGKREDHMDALVPGFGVRVTDKGKRTFILVARFPGSSNPTRRALGEYSPMTEAEEREARSRYETLPEERRATLSFDGFMLETYGATTLAGAREKARAWLGMIARGKDPSTEEERQRAAELRRQENSFALVAEDFIRDKLTKESKGAEVARDIRRVFGGICPEDGYFDGVRKGVLVGPWAKRPISDITALEVRNLIVSYKDRPYQAHNLLGYARRLFNWAIDQHVYGLEVSPCDRLKPKAIIGEKQARNRVLSDMELQVAWDAAGGLGYPYGPLFRMLLLTGQRKSEVGEARWREFDLDKKTWTIPAERMKSEAAHIVPLSEDMVALLRALPRFNSGDYLFSTTFGRSPVNGFSKGKARLDKAMLKLLATAGADEAHQKTELASFVIHDLRRTVRTHLSALPVPDMVRELVIAHTKPGLHKVYDQYAYLDEKRHALELWAARLMSIVQPSPANVVPFEAAKA